MAGLEPDFLSSCFRHHFCRRKFGAHEPYGIELLYFGRVTQGGAQGFSRRRDWRCRRLGSFRSRSFPHPVNHVHPAKSPFRGFPNKNVNPVLTPC